MFKSMKQLFTSKNKDLRHRIYFTLGALMIFILGISIRVPGTEDLTSNLGFLELINTMGGGALKNFSIFALGVMPYITASIIMQLLQMDIIPYFTELRKQGKLEDLDVSEEINACSINVDVEIDGKIEP